MSTQVSATPGAFAPGAERRVERAAGGSRSTSWRLYLALALGSLLVGSLSLLYPSTPSYDPWGWLLWGRELLHLKLNTVGANSFKPLPVLFTLPFALFGKAQPDLWLVVGRAGAVFAVAMAFRLAARLTLWFGPAKTGPWSLSRAISYGPAALAGAIAAICIVIAPEYLRDAAIGYSECLAAGIVLLAVDRHLDERPRQAFVLGFFPALDRPEIWAFWGLYGLYLWRRDPAARKLVAALFAVVPCLWFLPELWGSGHLFRGVSAALHPHNGAIAFTKCPFCTEVRAASRIAPLRVKVAAVVMVAGALIAIGLGLRRRTSGLAAAVREQSHRPQGVVIALAVVAILWVLEISTMTQYGFSGNTRYLIIGAALGIVVAAVGWGVAAWKLGELLGRWLRPAPGAAVAALALAGVFLFFPNWVGTRFNAHALNRALHYQADLRADVATIIRRAGGEKKVVACGSVETENYEVPMVAFYLGVESIDVADEPPPQPPGTPPPPDPGVIFQTRDTGTGPLLPKIPRSEHYTKITQRTFSLYEHCK